jgi:hypothetical protein
MMTDISLPRRAPGRSKREKAMLLTACEECGWEFETTNPHHRLCPTGRPVPIKRPKPVRDCGYMPREQYEALIAEANAKPPLPLYVRQMLIGDSDFEPVNINRSNGLMD